MRQVFTLLVATAVTVLSAQGLFAQSQGFSGGMLGGGGGGGGMGGSFGGGGMSGGGMGSSGMGMGMGSGMGSSSTGGLTMLSASSLSGGFGQLGFGAMNGFGSSTGGSSMYGGRAYGAVTQAGGGTGMSGGGRTGTTGGSTSSGSGGGGSGQAASTNRGRGRTQNASTASKEQQAWFEPRIEIGFETAPPRLSAVASTVATSLGANKPNSRFGNVQVAFEGGTAILRGVVATPNDRILAEQIALLEPSVSAVRNDLTVAPRTNPPTGR